MRGDQPIPSDPTGYSTLLNINAADRFNEWMCDEVEPYMNGRILEIGSGIGNISSTLLKRGVSLYLSDYSREYHEFLRHNFAGKPGIKGIFNIDLAGGDFASRHADLLESFDTIFALNVIEHIGDDQLAVANCCRLLKPGGRLLLLMPAYPAFYNRLDKELGHYRRYTRQTMTALMSPHLRVERTWHFNLAGIFGWWLFGSVLGKRKIDKGQMSAFNKGVPLFRLADRLIRRRIGLSIIAVGKKQGAERAATHAHQASAAVYA